MIFILMFFVLLGCHSPIYVADDCDTDEVELIERASKKASKAFDMDIEIVGRRGGAWYGCDERSSVFCIHEYDTIFDDPEGIALGLFITRKDFILMNSFAIDGDRDRWLSVMMHELGHFAGELDNDIPGDMMYRYQTDTPVMEY